MNLLQKLSFEQLLDELGTMKLKLSIIIPTIFVKGREKSLTDIQIRESIKARIDIPESTLRRYLPESAKIHRYPKHNESLKVSDNDDKKDLKESTSQSPKIEDRTQESIRQLGSGVLQGSSDTEPSSESATDDSFRSVHESGYVYRDWTLEVLIFKYQHLEIQNKNRLQELTEGRKKYRN
jgi:hypothetical protein